MGAAKSSLSEGSTRRLIVNIKDMASRLALVHGQPLGSEMVPLVKTMSAVLSLEPLKRVSLPLLGWGPSEAVESRLSTVVQSDEL